MPWVKTDLRKDRASESFSKGRRDPRPFTLKIFRVRLVHQLVLRWMVRHLIRLTSALPFHEYVIFSSTML